MSVNPATFRCGHYQFSLDGPAEVAPRIHATFADLLAETGERSATRWHVDCDSDRYVLKIDDLVQFRARSAVELVHRSVPLLTRNALDARPEALHFHAMAVLDDASAIVVAGPSGAGKSTLCAAAVSAGAAYMTDEAIAIDPDSLSGHGYRKPLVVKRPAFEAVRALTGLEPPTDTGAAWDIPASRLGALAADKPHPVDTIVSYRHRADEPVTVQPMHRASMVHELLSDALDAVRFGADSVVVAARLAEQCTCLTATGSDATAIAEQLRARHREPVQPGIVHIVAPAAGSGPRRSAKITSAVIDGRAVLYDPVANHVVELDETATLWWQLLDGSPVAEVVADVAAETAEDPSYIGAAASRIVEEFTALRLLDCD